MKSTLKVSVKILLLCCSCLIALVNGSQHVLSLNETNISCFYELDVKFMWFEFTYKENVGSIEDCCNFCVENSRCIVWSLEYGRCSIKSKRGPKISAPGSISGFSPSYYATMITPLQSKSTSTSFKSTLATSTQTKFYTWSPTDPNPHLNPHKICSTLNSFYYSGPTNGIAYNIDSSQSCCDICSSYPLCKQFSHFGFNKTCLLFNYIGLNKAECPNEYKCASSFQEELTQKQQNFTNTHINTEKDYYIGCFLDSTTNRDLNFTQNIPLKSVNMTVEWCITQCRYMQAKFAGLQFSDECFCGQTYGHLGKLQDSECDLPCVGNKSQNCGGISKNSVYKVDLVDLPSVVNVTVSELETTPMVTTTTAIITSDFFEFSTTSEAISTTTLSQMYPKLKFTRPVINVNETTVEIITEKMSTTDVTTQESSTSVNTTTVIIATDPSIEVNTTYRPLNLTSATIYQTSETVTDANNTTTATTTAIPAYANLSTPSIPMNTSKEMPNPSTTTIPTNANLSTTSLHINTSIDMSNLSTNTTVPFTTIFNFTNTDIIINTTLPESTTNIMTNIPSTTQLTSNFSFFNTTELFATTNMLMNFSLNSTTPSTEVTSSSTLLSTTTNHIATSQITSNIPTVTTTVISTSKFIINTTSLITTTSSVTFSIPLSTTLLTTIISSVPPTNLSTFQTTSITTISSSTVSTSRETSSTSTGHLFQNANARNSIITTVRVEITYSFQMQLGTNTNLSRGLRDAFLFGERKALNVLTSVNDNVFQSQANTQVFISEIKPLNRLNSDNTKQEIQVKYSVRRDNQELFSDYVSDALNLLTTQELFSYVGLEVVEIGYAENNPRIIPIEENNLWIIGAVVGPLAALFILFWTIGYVYYRCISPAKKNDDKSVILSNNTSKNDESVQQNTQVTRQKPSKKIEPFTPKVADIEVNVRQRPMLKETSEVVKLPPILINKKSIEIETQETRFSQNDEIQKSIRQKSEIEKWRNKQRKREKLLESQLNEDETQTASSITTETRKIEETKRKMSELLDETFRDIQQGSASASTSTHRRRRRRGSTQKSISIASTQLKTHTPLKLDTPHQPSRKDLTRVYNPHEFHDEYAQYFHAGLLNSNSNHKTSTSLSSNQFQSTENTTKTNLMTTTDNDSFSFKIKRNERETEFQNLNNLKKQVIGSSSLEETKQISNTTLNGTNSTNDLIRKSVQRNVQKRRDFTQESLRYDNM